MAAETRLDPHSALGQSLLAGGFRRLRNGSYARNGVLARPGVRWLSFQSPVKSSQLDPLGDTRRLGLWKPVPDGSGAAANLEFHLPLLDCFFESDDLEWGDTAVSPLQAIVQWAVGTASGELPEGWQSPPRHVVEGWIPEGQLSVQMGPLLCQGSVICQPNRLELAFPLVRELARELPAARRAWLGGVLDDAQRRWRLVRIVLADPPAQPAVVAVIDLSGAPHAVLEDLFRISLDTLRWGVQFLLWPVSFLCDPGVSCRTWDTHPADLFRKEHCHERA